VIEGASAVIGFLKAAFDTEVTGITYGPERPDGSRLFMNAEVRVGSGRIMIADSREGAPANLVDLCCYVEDVDACHARALAAGGEEIMPPMDMFYRDRHGGVKDPAGNLWYIASRIEDLADKELQAREDKFNEG
jgi:PhnB protein